MTAPAPCSCWLACPPVLHEGYCCFMDDPTPLNELKLGQPLACGHWVEVAS